MNRRTHLALAAVLLASGLAPGAATAEAGVRVSYRDLDLATADGQAVLATRLRRAADGLCHAGQTRELAPLQACRNDVLAGVTQPIQLALHGDAVRLAAVAGAAALALR